MSGMESRTAPVPQPWLATLAPRAAPLPPGKSRTSPVPLEALAKYQSVACLSFSFTCSVHSVFGDMNVSSINPIITALNVKLLLSSFSIPSSFIFHGNYQYCPSSYSPEPSHTQSSASSTYIIPSSPSLPVSSFLPIPSRETSGLVIRSCSSFSQSG